MKKCSKCNRELDDSSFSKSKTLSSGLRSSCKECDRAYAEAHKKDPAILASKRESAKRYYYKNRESVLKKNSEYLRKNYASISEKRKPKIAVWNKENYEKHGAVIRCKAKFSQRAFNILNPGVAAGKAKIFRKENPQYHKEWTKKFRTLNPEEYKRRNFVQHSKRRARALAVEDSPLSKEEWLSLMHESGWRCSHCGVTLSGSNNSSQRHVDHIFPLSKGFPMSIVNAAVLCKSCNSRKHDKSPFEFFSSEAISIAKARAEKHPDELKAYLARLSEENARTFLRFLSLTA